MHCKLYFISELNNSFTLPPTHQGFMIPSVKVYSMVAVQSSHVLLGTETGLILVYDGYTRKKTHQFTKLPDAVLCLHFFR